MNVEIVQLADRHVLGITTPINPMSADYRDIWDRLFMPHQQEVAAPATEKGYYGVYYGTGEEGVVDFMAGQVVAEGAGTPEGCTLRKLPGGTYAKFACTMPTIGPTWGGIYGQWLPSSDYAQDESARPAIEYYPPGAEGPNSPVVIFVSVRQK